MPTINLYGTKEILQKVNQEKADALKDFAIDQLSCGERILERGEFTLRLLEAFSDKYMMAPLECDIAVHHYPERIEKEDEICDNFRTFLLETFEVVDARVWLQLSELGHSM